MRKERIYIGHFNIASTISDLKCGFEGLGHEVVTAVDFENVIVESGMDYDFSKMKGPSFSKFRPFALRNILEKKFGKKSKFLRKHVDEFDVFIFIWNSFYPDYSDLEYLKSKGKKVVVFFVGSDIRWLPAHEQFSKSNGLPPVRYNNFKISKTNFANRIKYLRIAEKHADVIYSTPNSSELALKPYKLYTVFGNVNDIETNDSQREIPKIVHIPSNRATKGTDKILKSVEELKSKGLKFEFDLYEKIPHKEVMDIYKDSDIVISQLYGMGIAKQGFEVLASGTILVTSLNRMLSIDDRHFEENPTVKVREETLTVELEKLILDFELRQSLAKKSRPFIEKYHDNKEVCKRILLDLESAENSENIEPYFYPNKYVPSYGFESSVLKKWDNYYLKSNTSNYK